MVFAAMSLPSEPDEAPRADDVDALIEQARALQQAFASGRMLPLLRGRNIGLLCPDATTPEARLFREAAGGLGAQVAYIQANGFVGGGDSELANTARMLGRLYDVVVCQDLPPGVSQQLAALTGNLVCDGLAVDAGLIDKLVRLLDGAAEVPDSRRIVLQALLLRRLT